MLADYFNNPLMPMSYSGVSEKWYVVACTLERSLFKKLDVFLYLSATHDNAFNLLYVSYDEINRNGLWRKKYLVVDYDETAEIVALSNKIKSKCWIMSKKLPNDETAFDKIIKSCEKYGIDVKNLQSFY